MGGPTHSGRSKHTVGGANIQWAEQTYSGWGKQWVGAKFIIEQVDYDYQAFSDYPITTVL